MKYQSLCHYLFELGTLKKIRHCGTQLAGVFQPDSVAEHVYRTAIIGYILATMEKVDAQKVMLTCLLHDNGEARITDLHKVARRYINSGAAEMEAFREQTSRLPAEIGNIFFKLFEEFEAKETPESIVARDADLLETAFQAKEYLDIGYKSCADWIANAERSLTTKSAKKLIKIMKKTEFTAWWRGLKKIEGF